MPSPAETADESQVQLAHGPDLVALGRQALAKATM